MLGFQTLAAVFALLMLARHLPRALLFLFPGLVSFRPLPDAGARSPAELRAREELERLGFAPVGAFRERAPLGAVREEHEVFAHRDGLAWADLAPGRAGARVRFVSPLEDGELVATANEGRPGQPAALSGATLDATWAAHRKGVARLAPMHGGAAAARDLTGRITTAAAAHRRGGRAELRRASVLAFANAVLAAAILGVAVKALAAALIS
jgi:hypothetical protein